MKRIFCVNLIVLIILSLCSCGLTVTETDNSASHSVTETSSENGTTAKTIFESVSETETQKTEVSSQTDVKTTKTENQQPATQTTKEKTSAAEKTTPTKKIKQITCTFEISCENILKNKDKLKEDKSAFLPQNGNILNSTTIKIPEGSSVFDVIKKVCAENTCTDNCKYCKKNGIHLDYVYTPGYENYYIRGIHQIYEKDCGSQSGWMYSVNGIYPNYGCSEYKVKDGDVIKFQYTCDLGDDLGAKKSDSRNAVGF